MTPPIETPIQRLEFLRTSVDTYLEQSMGCHSRKPTLKRSEKKSDRWYDDYAVEGWRIGLRPR
ncbi:MAG: hypothetical protein KC609_05045 [Myxococcales bacterium]|nr:hypothetical protein [Myxococcales bacterium]